MFEGPGTMRHFHACSLGCTPDAPQGTSAADKGLGGLLDGRAGIEAFGWLPSGRGAQDFITYAEAQGADLLVVPEDLDDEGLFARFRGAPSPGEIAEKATMAVLTVPVTAAA